MRVQIQVAFSMKPVFIMYYKDILNGFKMPYKQHYNMLYHYIIITREIILTYLLDLVKPCHFSYDE